MKTDTASKTKTRPPYIGAIGRRKTSVARVRITEAGKSHFSINGKDLSVYFPTEDLRTIVRDAFLISKVPVKFDVSVVVNGGGIHAQAEAVRHGIARALVSHDEHLRSLLKEAGFLKRDPRVKERKKPGLKKARKAPQWSKR